MESAIDQILLTQDTIMAVRRRDTGIDTISEIVSREIDPVLFILPLQRIISRFNCAQRHNRTLSRNLTHSITS